MNRNRSARSNSLLANWHLIIAAILLLIPLIYSCFRLRDASFWDAAVGNWLATMLGVAGGIPIALEIERWRSSREEEAQAKLSQNRAQDVLNLLKKELHRNLEGLELRSRISSSFFTQPFRNELWRALSDAGEIKWINDPSVIDALSLAYHFVGIVRDIEAKTYSAIRGINPKYDDGSYASDKLLNDARSFDNAILVSLSAAISQIDILIGSVDKTVEARPESDGDSNRSNAG